MGIVRDAHTHRERKITQKLRNIFSFGMNEEKKSYVKQYQGGWVVSSRLNCVMWLQQ